MGTRDTVPVGPYSDEMGLRRRSLLAEAAAVPTLVEAYRSCRSSAPARERDAFDRAWPDRMTAISQTLRASRMPGGPEHRRRFDVPKSNGGTRQIEMPSLEEAIAQKAVALILTPVVERRFLDCSYAYRPGRDRLDALRQVTMWHRDGCRYVFRSDIERCFDELDHAHLRGMIRGFIGDARLRQLLGGWLATVGERRRTGRWPWRGSRSVGVPQGAVLSPMLANIYLHALDVVCTRSGLRYVRYGDDLLVAARSKAEAEAAGRAVRCAVRRFRLRISEEKSRVEPLVGCTFLGATLPIEAPRGRRAATTFAGSTYWLRRVLGERPARPRGRHA